MPTKTKKHEDCECDCDFCKRSRKFYKIIKKLPKNDEMWIGGLYEYLVNLELEAEKRQVEMN